MSSGSKDPQSTIERILIVSLDDPSKGGGVGGKHTHIRLLVDGLNHALVGADVVAVKENVSFRMLHKYPMALRRRFTRSRDERYLSYLRDFRQQLRRELQKSDLKYSIANPHDVPSLSVVDREMTHRSLRLPLVLTLHGYFTKEMTSVEELTRNSKEERGLLAEEIAAYRRAERIVCVDHRIRDYVIAISGISKEKTAVLPNAVDVLRFRPVDSHTLMGLKGGIGIAETKKIILCPRRLVPKNGVDIAVRAMESIAKEAPESIMVIVGDGPQRGNIESLIRDLDLDDFVRMEGAIPHAGVLPYFQSADVIVIPSIRSENVEEATSLSMLEGMACAKPVVVSDIGGLKETVRDKWNGLVVPERDPFSLSDACLSLLADGAKAESMGNNAHDYVQKNHSHIIHARRFLAECGRIEMTT